MSSNGMIRKRIKGIRSSRIAMMSFGGGTAIMGASLPFVDNPELFLTSLVVTAGGTVGSYLHGLFKVKKQSLKHLSSDMGVKAIPVPDSIVAKAVLGVPFEPQRVLLGKHYYQEMSPQERMALMVKGKRQDILPLHLKTDGMVRPWEVLDYFVCDSTGVYLEQILRPTEISLWDQSYQEICRKHNLNNPQGSYFSVDSSFEEEPVFAREGSPVELALSLVLPDKHKNKRNKRY